MMRVEGCRRKVTIEDALSEFVGARRDLGARTAVTRGHSKECQEWRTWHPSHPWAKILLGGSTAAAVAYEVTDGD